MSIFKGAATALITPFNPDGSVNYEELRRLLDKQIADGIDAFVICGTTGEASTLSHEEHIEVIRVACEHVNGRVPVIAGTGSNSTETAIYLSKEAEKAGADAVLLVSPYYNKSTQKGLYEHFADTAKAINIPALLYNIQGRTGVNIAPSTIAKLAKDIPNIVGVKEASGNISQVAEIAKLCGPDFDIYSGNDDQVVPLLSLGGKGVISVASHVIPKEMSRMVHAFLEGNVKEALDLQLKYLDLMHALFIEVNPIPVKEAMNMMGFAAGPFRKPLVPMEDENREKLRAELKKIGAIS
jgi:4-hydroxy-tetrahydrodipicolinate synthase